MAAAEAARAASQSVWALSFFLPPPMNCAEHELNVNRAGNESVVYQLACTAMSNKEVAAVEALVFGLAMIARQSTRMKRRIVTVE